MKMKKMHLVFSLFILSFFLFACGEEAAVQDTTMAEEEVVVEEDKTVTDLVGREVTIPADAKKYVCLGPGALRMYSYVADTENIVGIENIEKGKPLRPYMLANPNLQTLDVIGAGGPNDAPDEETLLISDIDVIFTTYSVDATDSDQLQEKTGIPVVTLGAFSDIQLFAPGINESIELIGEVTGNEERAKEVVDYFTETKLDLENRVKDVKEEDKLLTYIGAKSRKGSHGIESTSGDYSIFNAIGARNAVTEAGINQYAKIDKEALLEMDPEIIFIDAAGLELVKEDYAANEGFYKQLQAFETGELYLQLPYNFYSTNFEIAIADAYYMGSILFPEEYSDIDPVEKFNQTTQKLLGEDLYEEIAQDYSGGFQKLTFE